MFQIAEYHDEDAFQAEEKELQGHKLNWRGVAGEGKEPESSPHRETTSTEAQELRRRIGSDPPLPESELPDEVGTFRGRSQSAPPILWAAQRYGRELRRMSDEFHGALQKLPRPKSAGAASQLFRASGWKETLQSWWRLSSPGPPKSPP
ncbi:bcl2-associated agonist of cell death [Eublepharis macularius]|uniref:Bcl2-associated agonist of cell death n=1 Tax=Eublepharis macularius TaxID=481883 RepID=A0AA97K6U2_EUBMA|nr:bcl2-associated agonist of cell death [Eublepharis macularius]